MALLACLEQRLPPVALAILARARLDEVGDEPRFAVLLEQMYP